MAKVKYDVSDVEAGGDFDTPVPVGVYRCKIADVTEGTSKSSGNPMLTVEYEIVQKGEWKGRKLWDYIVLSDSAAWKLRQFVDALGRKAKGTLDTNAVIGDHVLIKAKHETDDRDPENPIVRARVGSVSPIPEVDDEEEDDEDVDDEDVEEEDDDDEGEDEDDDDDDEDDEDEEDEDDDEELTAEDLEEYDREQLEELVEEDEDLEVKFNKRTSDDVLRSRIAEALGIEEEEDEDEEDEEDEDEDDEEQDYEEWSIKDLTTELKTRGLNTKTKQTGAKKKRLFIQRLEKDDASDEPF